MKNSVEVADVLFRKVVCSGNAYSEEHTNGVFIDGLPASIQSAVEMFCGRNQDAHFLGTSQHVDTLLEQARQIVGPVATQNRKSRFDKARRTSQVEAT